MGRKSGIIVGVILILLGLLFLASEIAPEYFQFWDWPVIIIGMGGLFLIWAIVAGIGGLAVPGSILSGIGGILYYQNLTGDWASWSYIWALIPGFVGVGIILAGIIDRDFRDAFFGGLTLIIISGIIFFALGAQFGLDPEITQYWPALLILLGLVALVRALVPRKKKRW